MTTSVRSGWIPPRIGVVLSIVLFGVPALALWAATALLIPLLVQRGWTPHTAWFLTGSLAFLPILAAALAGARAAMPEPSIATILDHLRVRRMTPTNWWLAARVLVFIGVTTTGLYFVNASVWPRLPSHPPFLTTAALEPGQCYVLLLWLPFFALNIFGEELWWRGFIQPRQEPVFGRFTWIVQGTLHAAFHLSFGPGLIFILLPTVFALPWAVQRTQNTTVGIVVHAGINGPAFVAISLGASPT